MSELDTFESSIEKDHEKLKGFVNLLGEKTDELNRRFKSHEYDACLALLFEMDLVRREADDFIYEKINIVSKELISSQENTDKTKQEIEDHKTKLKQENRRMAKHRQTKSSLFIIFTAFNLAILIFKDTVFNGLDWQGIIIASLFNISLFIRYYLERSSQGKTKEIITLTNSMIEGKSQLLLMYKESQDSEKERQSMLLELRELIANTGNAKKIKRLILKHVRGE
ncbi:hypothetical protein MID13_09365 [Vibrio gigantis]|uniref:hypothetical protein n=1 Tax=Vibrio gigantis TaxID=296199 RepID=UPI001EFBF90A|nr:hypothetical protein [Vibrio gigantis]ULN63141.1 hypothetical protein MID13_09365 [Vibrio gigantis]